MKKKRIDCSFAVLLFFPRRYQLASQEKRNHHTHTSTRQTSATVERASEEGRARESEQDRSLICMMVVYSSALLSRSRSLVCRIRERKREKYIARLDKRSISPHICIHFPRSLRFFSLSFSLLSLCVYVCVRRFLSLNIIRKSY